jgi:hypothetical protein
MVKILLLSVISMTSFLPTAGSHTEDLRAINISSAIPLSTETLEAPPPSLLPFTQRFEQAVNGWIAELSKQPELADWRHAKWRRQPLGPGMHGWIVLITEHEKTIGYLVVSIDDAGNFQLSEYGQGEYQI